MEHEDLRAIVRNVLAEKKATEEPVVSSWVPWSARALAVPFRANDKAGVGPGENRLATEWGGKTMGQSVSYDVVDKQNRKWEVKFPGKANEVRIEQEGVRAIQPALRILNRAVSQIVKMFGKTADPKFQKELTRIFAPDQLEAFQQFAVTDAKDFARGEISTGRAVRLRDILRSIAQALKAFQTYQSTHSRTRGSRFVSVGMATAIQKKHDVDVYTIVRVAKLLKMSPSEIMSELDVGLDELVSATLAGPAFKDPDAFMEANWTNAVRPSEIFGDVDGVVLVSEQGYRVIPHDRLDDELYFKRVSKGNPYLAARTP